MRSAYHFIRMNEPEWRAAVVAAVSECERALSIDVDTILSAPRRAPMPPADLKRLKKGAALYLLVRTSEAA